MGEATTEGTDGATIGGRDGGDRRFGSPGESRYVVISSDCHAGASHETYREYLDPAWRDEFDAWRTRYSNPFRDLQGDARTRNWDHARRNSEQEADGVVAEVVYPNTVPPFFPTGALVARPPTAADYAGRLAGIRAHNRWLAEWCAEFPERRAGVGQIFLWNLDDALEDVAWCAEHGLRGGVLVPQVPDDVEGMAPLFSPHYDPLWALCEDLGVIVNQHSGGGAPGYARTSATGLVWIAETPFFSRRGFTHLLLSGVFERFPALRYVLAEIGAGWLPEMLATFEGFHRQIRDHGRIGELGFPADVRLPLPPTEYVRRNCWFGVSFADRADVAVADLIGPDRIMWGSDYPHHEGSYPYTTEALRWSFADRPSADVATMVGGAAAALYGFDFGSLRPLADRCGPRVAEVGRPITIHEVPTDATSSLFQRYR